MSAYRKFSDRLQTEAHAPSPSKAAKAPKVDPIGAETFGGLGALGEGEPQIRNSAPPMSPLDRGLATWGEAERAAIVEHDGGIPRAWAEGFARLHPDRPPSDVPLRRWQIVINDIGRFLDAGWPRRRQRWGGDRWTCSVAIGNGPSSVSIMPVFCGCSMATGLSSSIAILRSSRGGPGCVRYSGAGPLPSTKSCSHGS
jgi:hypothetical protein